MKLLNSLQTEMWPLVPSLQPELTRIGICGNGAYEAKGTQVLSLWLKGGATVLKFPRSHLELLSPIVQEKLKTRKGFFHILLPKRNKSTTVSTVPEGKHFMVQFQKAMRRDAWKKGSPGVALGTELRVQGKAQIDSWIHTAEGLKCSYKRTRTTHAQRLSFNPFQKGKIYPIDVSQTE